MSCDTILDRLPDWVANRLDPVETASIERHLEGCPDCRAEAELLRALRDAGPAQVPVGLEERIHAAARAELAESAGTRPIPLTVESGGATGTPGARRPRSVPSWALGAAAVFVLALGTPLLVDRMEESDASLPVSGEPAIDEPIATVWASADGLIAGAPAIESLTDEELALLLEEFEG